MVTKSYDTVHISRRSENTEKVEKIDVIDKITQQKS